MTAKEKKMRCARMLAGLSIAMLVSAGLAGADVKVVQHHHQDAFSMMGQNQPASDEEHVTWIGDGKLRMDQGATSTIVDLDAKKMFIVKHDDASYTAVDLPVDLKSLLPPGMGEQVMAMMQFDVTVTPSEETKKVGEWTAKRYDLKMTSAMMSMSSVLWASTETPVDFSKYFDLYSRVMSLQPGMEDMMEGMRKIDGFVVSQEATMSMKFMGETTVGSSDLVTSIETVDPPAGIYAPPTDYAQEEFDFMKMMQDR
jgi:hypothetical protein